jgi:Spy/CpxP family protein refolding chaperone
MLKKLLSLFLLIIFFTAPAMAREENDLPHGKWWNNTELAGQLNLTDNEVKLLDDMYVSHRRKIMKLYASVEIEQFELNNLIDSKTLDDEAVLNQSKRLEQARSVLSTERFQFFLDIRKLLGFDRYQQLKSMYRTLRHNKKYDRFKNKMNKRYDGAEKLRPSSYKDNDHFRKLDYRNDKDMDSPELIEQPTPDISPYNNSKNLSGENL